MIFMFHNSAIRNTSRRRMASRFWAKMEHFGALTMPHFVSCDGLPSEQSTNQKWFSWPGFVARRVRDDFGFLALTKWIFGFTPSANNQKSS